MIIFICIRTGINLYGCLVCKNSKKNPVKVLPIRDYILESIDLSAEVVLYPYNIAFIGRACRICMLPDF